MGEIKMIKNKNLNKKDYEKGYLKFMPKASEYLKNPRKANNLWKEATTKANKDKGKLEEIGENVQTTFDLFKAWIKGEYKEVPTKSISLIIASLIYFVSPVDLIPDFIVGLGLFDDVAVMGFVIKQVSKDLEKFKMWKATTIKPTL